ncbi:endolytic transglycosylase MltG [Candidatus Halobeggiatoa sp. HSG11]|nr:endolytic transglycosylase MltG [Candidatus Halobeggiatoa sp. HSG11]
MLRTLFLLILLIISSIGGSGYWIYKTYLVEPLPIFDDLRYVVKPNSNLRQITIDLIDKELMNYPTGLTWISLARFQKRAHLIKAGEYLIPVGTTPQQMLEIMISGKAISHTLMIPEGWNFKQMMVAIRGHPEIVQTLEGMNNKEIMTVLGWPDQHHEGRFYPDTYHFATGTTDVKFLKRSYRMMEKILAKTWEKRKEDLLLKTPYEALILASIVEKETAAVEERPLIAGVFMRRLKENMRLQTDPTVIYALGEKFDGNLRRKDLRVNNPYNTYKNKGLPPTPIAMPGRAALEAATNPTGGDALYFVAKGGGKHYFSVTLKEHECAVIEYQIKNKNPRRYRSRCKKYPKCFACS